MRRAVLGLSILVLAPALAMADGPFPLRLAAAAVASGASSARFTVTNQSPDELVYETYDGGNLHNGIERLERGAWTSVGLGYCGLGHDGDSSVAAGARSDVSAYVGTEPGTYRIVMHATRRDASGALTPVEIRSEPFAHR